MPDNVEIQGLEFQIKSNSDSAANELQTLKATLDRLKTATSGGIKGLTSVSNQLSTLSKVLGGINNSSVQKLKHLSEGLTALKNVGTVKISSSIANQLNNLSDALNQVKWTDGDKISVLAEGLQSLTQLGRANLTTFINQLGKLPNVIEQLDQADLDKFTQQMKELAAAMAPLADEMQKVSTGFSAFPSKVQKVASGTAAYNSAMRGASKSTSGLSTILGGMKFSAFLYGLKAVKGAIGTAITKSNEYQENLNLFTVAMGEYADEAFKYGQTVSDALGIDLSEWIRNQGMFNTLLTGFGDTAERSALMSKNLTQLGYDLSSFFNLPVEEAMQKLQSGISGELEPLRRLGYDLSQARLEAVALSLGIDKSVASMNQAEKAELRYYAIMTQVTTAQGDLARTLESPANQLRILKSEFNQLSREIGNIFIPALTKILPYAIAVVEVLKEIARAIADFFGFELTDVDYSGIGSLASGADNAASALDSAANSAKKLKQYTAGFDELNVFAPDSSSASDAGSALNGSGFDFELPDYNFLDGAIEKKTDEIKKKLDPFVTWIKNNISEILETVAAIGTAFLEWKVSKGLITFFSLLKGLSGKSLMYQIGFTISGLGLFLDGWSKIKQAIQDIQENGSNLTNVTQLISGFAEGLGVAFVILGKVKMGGALLVISGVAGVISDISDMVKNGPNWESATSLVNNLGIFLTGIGIVTNRPQLAGAGLALAGVSLIAQNLGDVIEAFRTGDWSGVDKVEVAAGVLLTIGGFLTAFAKIKEVTDKIGAEKSITDATASMQQVSSAFGGSSGGAGESASVSGGLNGTLKNLAKNLGLGIGIIAEVAAAAMIVVGSIAVLGMELDQVQKAWEPVIANGSTVVTGIVTGTAILSTIGAVSYALGTSGSTVALNVGIGTAILLELGIATGLFVIEIWAIGEGLNKIGEAWQPVLDNGETIATGIGIGTGLLVGIGVVTAALGAATVATAGALPIAIGLGTGILVELAGAFVAFTESLVAVSNELGNKLAPALRDLNGKLPILTTDVSNFSVFMKDFAGRIASYTDSMGSITWSSLVNGFMGLFKDDPIQSLSDDVSKIASDTHNLNTQLQVANAELKTAVVLMTDYSKFMEQLGILTSKNKNVTLASDMFINLREIGKNLVTGFVTGINDNQSLVTAKMDSLSREIDESFSRITSGVTAKWNGAISGINAGFTTFQGNMISGLSAFATKFNSAWNGLWNGLDRVFVSQWNSVLVSLEKALNNAGKAINGFIRQIKSIDSTADVGLNEIATIKVERIPQYAQGGFVDEGQLFVAREAGAEMVGSIGRRTAVANNDQIVEGISAGVSVANDGVIAAIYALMNVVEEKDMNVSITEDAIGRSYDRYNNRRGIRVNKGAFSNAY